jgi:hypothetical protein
VFHVLLDQRVVKLLAYQAFSVINGISWVLCYLVFGRVTNKTFIFSEGYLRGRGVVALIIGDDFHVVVAEDCNA